MREITRRELLAGTGAVLTAAAAASVLPQEAVASGVAKLPMPTTRELDVLIIGDSGTGDSNQYAVGSAAKKVCEQRGVALAVGLGDNIYECGARSDHDAQFATKFEQPYAGIDVPFLMTQGNHDNSGLLPGSGGNPAQGTHEVDYHNDSARWYMPDRYYSVAIPAGNPVAEFFVLDDTPVTSYTIQTDPYYHWDGPFMREQRAWLDHGLSTSTARWKIVLSHHPYLNNGPHGNAGAYDGFTVGDYASGIHFKELIEQVANGRADYLWAGHDHSLQLLDTAAQTGGTQQLVCGASAKVEDGKVKGTTPSFWQNFDQRGFMIAEIRDWHLALHAYTVDTQTATASLAYSHTRPR